MTSSNKLARAAAFCAAWVLAAAVAHAMTVRDEFTVAARQDIYGMVSGVNTENPKKSDSGSIGNRWGGYSANADSTAANKVQINHQTDDLRFSGNSGNFPGSYAYTIFNSAGGGAPPDSAVNNLARIEIQPAQVTTGLSIRILLRDGNGQWLISNQTFAFVDNTTLLSIDPTALTWANVPGSAAAEMDLMDGPDPGPGDISAFSGTPTANLTNVGGGGVYIATNDDTANPFRIDTIEFQESPGIVTCAKHWGKY